MGLGPGRVHADADSDAGRTGHPGLRREDSRAQRERGAEDRHARRRRVRAMSATAHPARTAPDQPAVQVEQLQKRFALAHRSPGEGGIVALDKVSFTVEHGELFGFIGPDGAGKTTLFRLLVSLLVPDGGRATVLGLEVVHNYRALRPRVGYMAGRFSLYPDLSVEENLRFFASVFGTTIDREFEQIKPMYTQLKPFRDRRAAAISGGMKQNLALCCSLWH